MKYLDDRQKYYHGTDKDLSELKIMPRTSGETKFLGDGIYITNSKKVASTYGSNLYEIKPKTPLNFLPYFDTIDADSVMDKLIELEMEYLAEEIADSLEYDDTLWGKQLINLIEREDLDVNETLLKLGYNAIEAPMNRLNQFIGLPDSVRNINVISDNLLYIV